MQPKVELSKLRTVSEILDTSILFIKQNLRPLLRSYFTICGVFWISGLAVSILHAVKNYGIAQEDREPFGWILWLSVGIELINQTLILILSLSFITIYKEKGKEAPTVEEVWEYVKYYFFRMFSSYLVLSVLFVAGLVCCVFPGVYFFPVMSLILTVMIMENTSLANGFRRAFNLISNSWGAVFGVLVVTFLLALVALLLIVIPAMIVAALAVFMTGSTQSADPYFLAWVIAMHLGQVLYVLPYIGMAFIYLSLIEQKENVTLLERIEAFGKEEQKPAEPDHHEEY